VHFLVECINLDTDMEHTKTLDIKHIKNIETHKTFNHDIQLTADR